MNLGVRLNGAVVLQGEAESAFASIAYSLFTGEIDLTGMLPHNYIEAIRTAYLQAYTT